MIEYQLIPLSRPHPSIHGAPVIHSVEVSVFRRRYFRELGLHAEAWNQIASAARRGRVTLVYSSHDALHNNAVALQEYLQRQGRRRAKPRKPAAHSTHTR